MDLKYTRYDQTIIRGTTFTLSVQFLDSATEQPIGDITGSKGILEIKSNSGQATPLVRKEVVYFTSPSLAIVEFTLDASDTINLTERQYVYDARIVLPTGVVYAMPPSKLVVLQAIADDVTI